MSGEQHSGGLGRPAQATRRTDGAGGTRQDPSHRRIQELLLSACLSPDHDACLAAVSAARAMGCTPAEIADVHVPAVAREMGALWCEDGLSFAAVTIGSSRLQAMLRVLGPDWSADHAGPADAATILVAVPAESTHSLGGLVVAGQLRRAGYSVRMLLGATPARMAPQFQNAHFDAVFLSCAEGGTLESLRKIVEFVRGQGDARIPVVLGGNILSTQPDAAQWIGADLATCDTDEALLFCGLTRTRRKAPERTAPEL